MATEAGKKVLESIEAALAESPEERREKKLELARKWAREVRVPKLIEEVGEVVRNGYSFIYLFSANAYFFTEDDLLRLQAISEELGIPLSEDSLGKVVKNNQFFATITVQKLRRLLSSE